MGRSINNKKIILLLTIVTIVVLLIGTTFSYWRWSTLRNEETNISLIASGSSDDLYAIINGGEPISNSDVILLPTNDCTGPSALQRTVSITYKNGTSQLAIAMAQLDVTRFNLQSGRTLNDNDLAHIHWAVTLDANSCTTNVVSSGTFEGITFTNSQISNMTNDSDYGYIYNLNDGDMMIPVPMNTRMQNESVSQNHYVYIWIDEDYVYTNYGNVIDDPMNDIEFTLEWHGKVKQVLCGDVNLDGVVTGGENDSSSDQFVVLRANMGAYGFSDDDIPTTPNYLSTIIYFFGDVDGNSKIESIDALTIYRAFLDGTTINTCRGYS